MKSQNFLKRYSRPIFIFALSGAVFLSLAHHTFRFWELPARSMALIFLLGASACAWIVSGFLSKLRPHAERIPAKRLALLIVFAILLGSFTAWGAYRVPNDDQTLTITPLLAQNQTVSLIEIKADGRLVRLKEAAQASRWREQGGVYYAAEDSMPMTLSFRRAVNAPVSILFERQPQGGEVQVVFERQTRRIDLQGAEHEEAALDFVTRYRGLPNGWFVPALVLFDLIAFSSLALAVLLIQEIGQKQVSAGEEAEGGPASHRVNLIVLLGIGIVLHSINILATPLELVADSPAYLAGAIHWLKFGDLSGVPVFRGPGTTFLFAPILWAFGRNPWGMQIFLHSIALACIPLSYWLGWQIGHRRWLAFTAGLIAALTPDLFWYSNVVMSDLPNLSLVLLYCVLLISAIRRPRFGAILTVMLTAAFASLLRSENILLLLFALIFLVLPQNFSRREFSIDSYLKTLKAPILAFGLACLPLIAWAAYFHQLYGFVSLGNHTGVVLYDGWVYYGDASKLSFSDSNSPAMQTLETVMKQYPASVTDRTGAPTSLELYPNLMKAGYSNLQAFQLMEHAALDSIHKDYSLTLELLSIKIKAAFEPELALDETYPLPGESIPVNEMKQEYFDNATLGLPPLIRIQRFVNWAIDRIYPSVIPAWAWFGVLALTFSLLRSPTRVWLALTAITATRIFIPAVMALTSWRYTLSGWLPLQIIAVSWIAILIVGVKALLESNRQNTPI